MGLIDYIKNIMSRRKETSYHVPSTYKKIRCNVCNQVCYNQKDLELHMKYNHPDVAFHRSILIRDLCVKTQV